VRPSQEFRFWLRRAPTGERVAAGVATLIAVALLAWLLVPGSGGGATNLAASGGGAGASSAEGPGPGWGASVPVAQGTGAATSGPAAGSASGRGTGQAGGATSAAATPGSGPVGPGCPPLAAGARGVTATQLKIAVMIVDIAGPAANSTFGLAPPAQQQADYEAVLDSVNKTGGIACRHVVAQFYNVNPADQNDQQSKCLTAVQAQPFLVIDEGSYSFTSPM